MLVQTHTRKETNDRDALIHAVRYRVIDWSKIQTFGMPELHVELFHSSIIQKAARSFLTSKIQKAEPDNDGDRPTA